MRSPLATPGASCAVPFDCMAFPGGPAIACCIHNACLYGEAAQAETCADAAAQDIMASNYDQSCQTGSDCVAIEEGNFCAPGASNGCTNAAINKNALAHYQADLAKTQASVCYGLASCTAEFGPCCQSGVCGVSGQCVNVLAEDASADAGSTSAVDAADASPAAERSEAGDSGTD